MYLEFQHYQNDSEEAYFLLLSFNHTLSPGVRHNVQFSYNLILHV